MAISRSYRQTRFALLIAALLLLCNALVTAHAFGEVDHAVKDGCQLLHQFEREQLSPAPSLPLPQDSGRHVPPADDCGVFGTPAACRHFQPRAPPLA